MKTVVIKGGVLLAAGMFLSGCWPASSVTHQTPDSVEITAEISAQISDIQPEAEKFCAERGKVAFFQSASCFDAACLEEIYLFFCR